MNRGKVRNHALYFLGVLTYVVALIPFLSVNLVKSLILIPIIAYTLPIMEYLQPKIMSLKIGYKDVLLIIPPIIPYIFLPYDEIVYVLIPLALMVLTFTLYLTKHTMWGNVIGTAFEASISIVWGVFINNSLFLIPSIYWLLYIFTGALYVEYKIPYRKLDKRIVQISWIISLVLIIGLSIRNPITLITLIEPSIRYLIPGEKLKSPKEIRDLGKKGSKKDILFVVLLAITYTLSRIFPII
ncbi:MAG: hypothetical protein QXY87_10210 [Saccharolobus sp.]|uniref:Uncharacterized protein n=1 Tax=Saccharolobus shibatae TaxID=2286 RepID=A0A8F5BW94_9CREN|nr:hypothetical protein [Saccharolobus shibatae]MCH4814680.1 hypothetical protein [Saccharolobus shibatae]QXJ32514.1 Uncharacterized protein J5U21_02165 [Saccharolobus shibatae]QXJ35675.1 Uncharacterized protein J5U22_02222 [Saccharolobus shibatae]